MPATHLYESHYVTHFFRLWGYEEGKAGKPIQSQLLGNMQNAFDSDFGDVCAQVGARLFIIEFKADRNGFAREVAPSGILLVDHQPGLIYGVRDIDSMQLVRNAVALAKGAKALGVPVVVTMVTGGPFGDNVHVLRGDPGDGAGNVSRIFGRLASTSER
jgi:hypothetical protein